MDAVTWSPGVRGARPQAIGRSASRPNRTCLTTSSGSSTQTFHAGRVAALGKWSAMAATVALHFQCSTTDLFRCPAEE